MRKRLFPVSARNCAFPEDAEGKIADQYWRLNHLYTVINESGELVRFKLRPQQNDFYSRMAPRNLILKSRRHGFTTLCCLLALDNAITRPNYRALFIQQSKDDRQHTFQDKIKAPWERLVKCHPDIAKRFNVMESEEGNKFELKLANGSSVSAALLMRPGTFQFLHMSEYAKICAETPDKAAEINAKAIPTLHKGATLIIESTAEGKTGDFYNKTMDAMKMQRERKPLGESDLKFFFYPWWMDLKNTIPPVGATLDPDDLQYFDKFENEHGVHLMPGQKVWYAAQKKKMPGEFIYREHPSSPEEAFQGRVDGRDGRAYGKILRKLRLDGHIQPHFPFDPRVPVNTSWHLGRNATAIWVHQYMEDAGLHRWLAYYENENEGLGHYWSWLCDLRDKKGFDWGRHFLPHNVAPRRMTRSSNTWGRTRHDYLWEMGLRDIVVVKPVPTLADGIEATRRVLVMSQFNETDCAQGLWHLEEYEPFLYDPKLQTTRSTPNRHKHSDAAAAIRQLAQAPDYFLRCPKPWRPQPISPMAI